jgi:hypothetical protein
MRRPLVALLLTALAPSAASAQDARTLERRLAVSMQFRDSAERALTAYRRRQPHPTYVDTFAIAGTPLRVVASGDAASLGREASDIAGRRLTGWLGQATTLMAPMVFYLRKDSTAAGVYAISGQLRGTDEVLNHNAPWSASALADVFVMQARTALVEQMDTTIRQRLGDALPVEAISDAQWAVIRSILATSYSPVAKRCLEQDLTACKKVLRLVPVADPATELFDVNGRRAQVAATDFGNSIDRAARQECLGGNDNFCVMLLRRARRDLVLGGQGAATLASEAFSLGGDGALDRLIRTRGTAGEILAATARQPLDTVIAHWALNVRDRGRVSESFSPVIAMVAIGWTAVLLGLAVRSSRWR